MQSSLPYINAKSASGLNLSKVKQIFSFVRWNPSYSGASIVVQNMTTNASQTFSTFGDTLKSEIQTFLSGASGKVTRIYNQMNTSEYFYTSGTWIVNTSGAMLKVTATAQSSANRWMVNTQHLIDSQYFVIRSTDNYTTLFYRQSPHRRGMIDQGNSSSHNLGTTLCDAYVDDTLIGTTQNDLYTEAMDGVKHSVSFRGGQPIQLSQHIGYGSTATSYQGDFYEYIASTEHLQDVQDAQLEIYGI